MARSLNKVQLIGNLTRDPELRYTPSGAAVCTFGLATNRSWTTDTGEKHEESEFHNIVSWNKLAELCSQFLVKGRKVYVEGRLATRSWQSQDGQQRTRTEVVIDDMILLDSKFTSAKIGEDNQVSAQRNQQARAANTKQVAKKNFEKEEKGKEETAESEALPVVDNTDVPPDDIPF